MSVCLAVLNLVTARIESFPVDAHMPECLTRYRRNVTITGLRATLNDEVLSFSFHGTLKIGEVMPKLEVTADTDSRSKLSSSCISVRL